MQLYAKDSQDEYAARSSHE